MESTQYEEVIELTNEETANLDELVKQEAESEEADEGQSLANVTENEGLDEAATANYVTSTTVKGPLSNFTTGPLHLSDKKIWGGRAVKLGGFPTQIDVHKVGHFRFVGVLAVMAGVVYTGKSRDVDECAWLLAFADTDKLGLRIYGRVGQKDKIIAPHKGVDWHEIERRLHNAGTTIRVFDPETGIRLYARITGTFANAVVAANYTDILLGSVSNNEE